MLDGAWLIDLVFYCTTLPGHDTLATSDADMFRPKHFNVAAAVAAHPTRRDYSCRWTEVVKAAGTA
jgi:hypothetical protein